MVKCVIEPLLSLLLPSRLTSIGFGMIAVGTLFQIGATLWQASAS